MLKRWQGWLIAGCTLLAVIGASVTAQDDLDAAIEAGLTRFNSLPGNLIRYREVARISDDTGAMVYAEVLNAEIGLPYPGVIDWVYLILENGEWNMVVPGDPNYRTSILRLSETLRSQRDDTLYRTQAITGLIPTERLLDYHLPFPPGAFGIVTQGYADHGTGKIDIDLTGSEVSAAKDGFIVFASDHSNLTTLQSGAWWYWNNVIIEHGEYEYSLYGHIAYNSIPQWIKDLCDDDLNSGNCRVAIHAGDVIGLEGSTGYSTNPHLHMEFGQGYGIVPYLDILDSDGDSIQEETVPTGYVYGEHNVGFIGFTLEEIIHWEYLTRLESPR